MREKIQEICPFRGHWIHQLPFWHEILDAAVPGESGRLAWPIDSLVVDSQTDSDGCEELGVGCYSELGLIRSGLISVSKVRAKNGIAFVTLTVASTGVPEPSTSPSPMIWVCHSSNFQSFSCLTTAIETPPISQLFRRLSSSAIKDRDNSADCSWSVAFVCWLKRDPTKAQ